MGNKEKAMRCRFCHPFMGKNHNEYHCVVNGWEDDKVKIIDKKDCESCSEFDSKYIEYPLTVNGINNESIDTNSLSGKCGDLCEVRPCGEKYNNKTYVGVFLGDLPIGITSSYDRKTGILSNGVMTNPAIFVPELKEIIYGCGSWWRKILKIDDTRDISDDDINNQWYVQMLKGLQPSDERIKLIEEISELMISGDKELLDKFMGFEVPEITEATKDEMKNIIVEELSEKGDDELNLLKEEYMSGKD